MSEKQTKEEAAKEAAAKAAKARSANPTKPAAPATARPATAKATKPVAKASAAPANGAPAASATPTSAEKAEKVASAATAEKAEKVAAAKVAKAKAVAKAAAVAAEPEEEDDEHGSVSHRKWMSRKVRQASTAFTISILINLAGILGLGLWVMKAEILQLTQELVATVDEVPQEEIQQELETEVTPATELTTESSSVSDHVGAMGSVSAMATPSVVAQTTDAPSELSIQVGELNVMAATGNKLSKELPSGALKGDAAVVADNYNQAMDRITQEIIAKLAKGKVLVVWCMDESVSMQDDRAEIMSRIGRVYQELGLSEASKGDALLTAVTSYGEKWTNHTPQPTSNIEAIVEAMNSVPDDPSGLENMCPAIIQTISVYRQFARGRQMMLITVSDESGEAGTNNQYLETAIAEARAASCPIYFLGREAIFGYPYATMWHTIPGNKPGTTVTYPAQIDRGPETPFPEQLQIDGMHRRSDALPSGFGPYEQCRLVRETNGIFFMLPSPETRLHNRDLRKYGPDAMRAYLPDLSARADYAAERDSHEMRAILWKVICDLNPYDKNVRGKINLRMEYSIDPPAFGSQAMQAMEEAKNLILYLHDAQVALEKVKPERDREASYRWRANYDLIYAQTIAYQVRLYEYGVYLDAFMKSPKPILNKFGASKPTNEWRLHGNKRFVTGEQYLPMAEKALGLFKQVIEDNPGTPWAARAEIEIKRPFGFDFVEHYQAPPSGPNHGVGVSRPKL